MTALVDAHDVGRRPTRRQLEVLHLLADGLTTAEISRELFITREAVKAHLGRIYKRIDAKRAAHAVAIGYRRGWLGGAS